MKVGTANYGNRKKHFKIIDGDNPFRILPPLGEMADSGRWFQYYRIEWGYKGSDGRHKPFQDCRKFNYETKEVEIESPAFLKREEIKNAKNSLNEALKLNPNDPNLLEQKKKLIEMGMQFNLEAKYYVNAVNLKGEIGLLKIGKRAMDGLQGQIKALRESGNDPLGLTGVFFNFFRSGTGLDTVYTVTPYRENVNVNGEIFQKTKTHTMDDAFISRLGSEAFELKDMYPKPTSEEVSRMVNEGVTAIDEILGKKEEKKSAPEATTNISKPVSQPQEPVSQPQEPVSQPQEPAPVNEVVETPLSESSEPVADNPPVSDLSQMSDADFLNNLKKLGS